MAKKRRIHEDYARSMLFGFEDALVSTTGVIVGMSAGTQERHILILAGVVTVAVEALSMGAGQYISERSVHQMKGAHHTDSVLLGALVMFMSYLLAGMIPIVPLFLFSYPVSTYMTMVFAFVGLFVLGYAKGTVTGKPMRSALEILAIGGAATLIGIVVGNLAKMWGIAA